MPTPFANLSFETVGASAGDAASWTLTQASSVHWAKFASALGGGQRGDDFEYLWGGDNFVNALVEPTNEGRMMFSSPANPQRVDTFEINWSNDGFQFAFSGGAFAEFANRLVPPPDPFEGFEGEWSNTDFIFAFASPDLDRDLFNLGTEQADDLEDGWNNDAYVFAFAGGGAAVFAMSDGSTPPYESFEDFVPDLLIAAVLLNGTITINGHGLSNGAKVTVFIAIDNLSQLPKPLASGVTYFVVNVTANTFGLSATNGGSQITFDDGGAGTNYVRTDTSKSWGGRDGDTSGSDP